MGSIYVSTTSALGTTTTIVDNTLIGGTDNYKGNWIIITSGAGAGEITRVSAFTGSTLTVAPTITAPISGTTYEMWTPPYHPNMINELINQAILDATGLAYDPEEDITLAGDGRQASFIIPTDFDMLDTVFYRHYVESQLVEPVTGAWSELVQAGLTAAIDSQHFKTGQSMKITVAAAAAANARITTAISSLDISKYDFIEFWIESSIATAAGDIHLLLDDTAQAASPLETLAVPALTAATPRFVRAALATPQLDTAIISVGLRFTTDTGASTVWLNRIDAVRDDTALWTKLNRSAWSIDKEARALKLHPGVPAAVGRRLLKLRGGGRPILLTTEGALNEIDDWYVICRATELAYCQNHGGSDASIQLRQGEAARWGRRADQAQLSFPTLVNARSVS